MASPFSGIINSVFGPPIPVQQLDRQAQIEKDMRATASPLFQRAQELRTKQPTANAQQLMTQLMADPAFTEAFVGGGLNTETIQKLVESMAPKPQEPYTLGPGDVRMGPDNEVLAQQPTTDIQTTDALMTFAGLTPQERKEVAAAQLEQQLSGGANTTAAERAGARLKAKGYPADVVDKILVGAFKEVPIVNELGQPMGSQIIDTTTNQSVNVPLGGAPKINPAPQINPQTLQEEAPPTPLPRLGNVDTPPQYRSLFDQATDHFGLPPGLLERQAYRESGFNPNAKSPKGALGISQFMPATARRFNVIDATDPAQAIPAQGEYMSYLLNRYKGNVAYALAGYNWGEGNVDSWLVGGADPRKMPEETQDYIRDILGPDAMTDTFWGETRRVVEGEQPAEVPTFDENQEQTETMADAVFGLGSIPSLAQTISQIGGQITGQWHDSTIAKRQQAVRVFRENLIKWGSRDGKEGIQEQNRLLALAPGGFFETPGNAVDKLIELRKTIVARKKQDEAIAADAAGTPREERSMAIQRIHQAEFLLSQIGSEKDLASSAAKARNYGIDDTIGNLMKQIWSGEQATEEIYDGATHPDQTKPETLAPHEMDDDTLDQEIQKLENGDQSSLPTPVDPSQQVFAHAAGGEGDLVSQDLSDQNLANAESALGIGEDQSSPEQRLAALQMERYARHLSRNTGVSKSVIDAGMSFNARVADAFSLPFETVLAGARIVGLRSMQGGKPPEAGAFARNFKKFLTGKGIPAADIETFAGSFGRGSFDGLVMAATLTAAAPGMSAKGGNSLFSRIVREMGDFALERPAQAAAGEVGASAAANVADEQGSGPIGTTAAGFAGGATATGLERLAIRTGRNVMGGLNRMVGRRGNVGATEIESDAIRPIEGEPLRASLYAEEQIAGDQKRVEDMIQAAVNRIPSTMNPAQASAKLQAELATSKKAAREIEKEYWKAVPGQVKIPTDGLRQRVKTIKADLKDKPGMTPGLWISRILGKGFKLPKSVDRLIDMRSTIGIERRAEEAKPSPNAGLIRSYNLLEEAILDSLDEGMPDSVPLKQALGFSRWLNEKYRRGLVGDLLSKRPQGDFRVLPEKAAQRALDRPGGMGQIVDLNDVDVRIAAENSVRALFRDEIGQDTTKGPLAGIKFVEQNREEIKALGGVSIELDNAAATLKQAVQTRDAISKSSMAKFAQSGDPVTAIKRVWNSPDPGKVARVLLGRFKGDPDAKAGFQAGILDELFSRTGLDMTRLDRAMQEPRTRRLLTAALDSEQWSRLVRLVDVAHSLRAGDEKNLRTATLSTPVAGLPILGRMLGAAAGRFLGTGTIQVPGATARIGENVVRRMLDMGLSKFADPQTLLRLAVTDPKFERLLLMRTPSDTKSLRKTAAWFRRITSTLVAAQHEANRRYTGDE